MGCIAIIPARFDSVRFPGKALAPLNGRPLIQHVAQRCSRIPGVERVIVATDDERIAAAARAVDAEAVMTPRELASGTDRVALVAATTDAEVVLNVQGDEPLIDAAELGEALAAFTRAGADYGTLRTRIKRADDLWNPNVVKVVIDADERALYFSRAPVPFPRQAWLDADNRAGEPTLRFGAGVPDGGYWQHVGVYLFRRPALARWARIPPSRLERTEGLEQLRILEAGATIHTFPITDSVPGVDTPEDLERVRRHVAEARG